MSEAYFRRIQAKYGLTKEAFLKLLVDQEGKCATCAREFVLFSSNRAERPVVDHCHEAEADGRMVVRGLLCTACNITAGFIEKNYSRTVKVMQYIGQRSRPPMRPVPRAVGRRLAKKEAKQAKKELRHAKEEMKQLKRQRSSAHAHVYSVVNALEDLSQNITKLLTRGPAGATISVTSEDQASDPRGPGQGAQSRRNPPAD